jgi:hypothetical protein
MAQSRRKSKVLKRKSKSRRNKRSKKLSRKKSSFRMERTLEERLKNWRCTCSSPSCNNCKQQLERKELEEFKERLKNWRCTCSSPSCNNCKQQLENRTYTPFFENIELYRKNEIKRKDKRVRKVNLR